MAQQQTGSRWTAGLCVLSLAVLVAALFASSTARAPTRETRFRPVSPGTSPPFPVVHYDTLLPYLQSLSFPLSLLEFPTPLLVSHTPLSTSVAASRWRDSSWLAARWAAHYKGFLEVKVLDRPDSKYLSSNKYYGQQPPPYNSSHSTLEHAFASLADLHLLAEAESRSKKMMHSKKDSNSKKMNMTVSEFFHRLHRSGDTSSSGEYLYYTDQIDVLPFALREDLIPFDFSRFLTNASSYSASQPTLPPRADPGKLEYYERQRAQFTLATEQNPLFFERHYPRCEFSVWIGSGGAVALPHEDLVGNFFLQLVGNKTFELVAPRHSMDVGLHPRMHPHHRQMKTDYTDPLPWGMSEGAPSGEIPVYTIALTPGDMLYLPSGYFHRVRSRTSPYTLSLNAWCQDEHSTAHNVLLHETRLPFEDHWERPQRVERAVDFVRRVLHRAHAAGLLHPVVPAVPVASAGEGEGDVAAEWVRYQLSRRYGAMMGAAWEAPQQHCDAILRAQSDFCGDVRGHHGGDRGVSGDGDDVASGAKLNEYVEAVVASLLRFVTSGAAAALSAGTPPVEPKVVAAARENGLGLAQMALSDWIEEVVHWAQQTHDFSVLLCCMTNV